MERSQQQWFYNVKWTKAMESKFVDVLVEQAQGGNIPKGRVEEGVILSAIDEVNRIFLTELDYRYCASKLIHLRNRSYSFNWLLNWKSVAYDPIENFIGHEDGAWDDIINKGSQIVQAFKEEGEPMYAAMKLIFEGNGENAPCEP